MYTILFLVTIALVNGQNSEVQVTMGSGQANGVNNNPGYVNGQKASVPGFNIQVNNGQITCAGVQCPSGTFECATTATSINNNNDIQMTHKCSAQNGNVLLDTTTTIANPRPGTPVNMFAQDNTNNNNALFCDNCSTSSEAQAEFNKAKQQAQQAMANMRANLQQQAEQREQNMARQMGALQAGEENPTNYGYPPMAPPPMYPGNGYPPTPMMMAPPPPPPPPPMW